MGESPLAAYAMGQSNGQGGWGADGGWLRCTANHRLSHAERDAESS